MKPKKTPLRSKSIKKAPGTPSLNSTLNSLASFAADDEDQSATVWDHEKLDWLKPGNIKDAAQKPPDHLDFNPTTLYVPQSFIKNLTPGMGNWWKIKSKNYDAVIFYKVGKFYEMYHMDAIVGVHNCGLTFMRGTYAHCGFPEMRFEHFASMLVNKGFKKPLKIHTIADPFNKSRYLIFLSVKGCESRTNRNTRIK